MAVFCFVWRALGAEIARTNCGEINSFATSLPPLSLPAAAPRLRIADCRLELRLVNPGLSSRLCFENELLFYPMACVILLLLLLLFDYAFGLVRLLGMGSLARLLVECVLVCFSRALVCVMFGQPTTTTRQRASTETRNISGLKVFCEIVS